MSKLMKVLASVFLAAALLALTAGPVAAANPGVSPDACWGNACGSGGDTI